MDANEQVYNALTADVVLDSLVNGRIWNATRGEHEELPALVFSRVSSEYLGSSKGTVKVGFVRYQLDGFSLQLDNAYAIARAAGSALVDAFSASEGSRRDSYDDQTKVWESSIDVVVSIYEE